MNPALFQAAAALFTFVPTIDGTVHTSAVVPVGMGVPPGVSTGVGTGVGATEVSAPQPTVILREATPFTFTCGIMLVVSGSSSGNEKFTVTVIIEP